MPKTKTYTGMGLLIYNAVQNLGMEHNKAAESLNISPSTLFTYYIKPPTNIETLIKLSSKLKINLLDFYKDREPLKGMLGVKDAMIQLLETEIVNLKKDKDDLRYTIDLQRKVIDSQPS